LSLLAAATSRGFPIVFGARGEVQREQAKCHIIPDFRKNQTERFF